MEEGESAERDLNGGRNDAGGFHSFEHRWALGEAFKFHQAIGKARIATRIHALNHQLKEGLAEMGHVTLHTPRAMSCLQGLSVSKYRGNAPRGVARLHERGIIASVTPYATRYARLAPSLLTSPEEINKTLREIENLA